MTQIFYQLRHMREDRMAMIIVLHCPTVLRIVNDQMTPSSHYDFDGFYHASGDISDIAMRPL